MSDEKNNPPLSRRLALLTLLWLTGLYLRVPILVAPPLAPVIGDDLALSQTVIGALTTLPVLMLAVGALPGALAIARLGARRTLALALVLVAASSAARGLAPPPAVLLAATAILGLGVAAMQPALPALVPLWCPGFVALGSAVYMNGMLMGEFVGAGLTLPVIMPLTGGSWRLTLLTWSLPALAVGVVVMLCRSRGEAGPAAPHWQPDWHDGTVWRLGALLGAAATVFFGTNAYMGSILADRGAMDALPATLFTFNVCQVAASVLMMAMSGRWLGRRGPLVITGLACVAGLALFTLTGGLAALAGALVVGFASAVQLILLVSLPPWLTDSSGAGRLSAGMFTLGYAVAFTVPLIGGMIADATGTPPLALAPVTAYALLAAPLALGLDLRSRDARGTGDGDER
ncbi:CynX/NimT family MFS transporter [Arhodomonas aquaeolei]|uniref:MFS transporter n=2 Tax=Arhodomonas TaxID=2368 RepID=UPI00036F6748|nr:MFS transporter [Arhodomonas aquaeolei]